MVLWIKTLRIKTAAWFAELVECQSAVAEVNCSFSRPERYSESLSLRECAAFVIISANG